MAPAEFPLASLPAVPSHAARTQRRWRSLMVVIGPGAGRPEFRGLPPAGPGSRSSSSGCPRSQLGQLVRRFSALSEAAQSDLRGSGAWRVPPSSGIPYASGSLPRAHVLLGSLVWSWIGAGSGSLRARRHSHVSHLGRLGRGALARPSIRLGIRSWVRRFHWPVRRRITQTAPGRRLPLRQSGGSRRARTITPARVSLAHPLPYRQHRSYGARHHFGSILWPAPCVFRRGAPGDVVASRLPGSKPARPSPPLTLAH